MRKSQFGERGIAESGKSRHIENENDKYQIDTGIENVEKYVGIAARRNQRTQSGGEFPFYFLLFDTKCLFCLHLFQCEVYKKDLELERTAKQKMVSQFEVDLQSLIKRSHTLIVGTADETPETVEKTSAQSFTPSLNVKTNVNHGLEGRMNAVARLFRIQNVKKKTEPIYTVLDDRRSPKGGRQFLIEVECNGETSRGTGLNKRSAKRMAAENILIKMGYAKDELAESEGSKKSSNEKSKRKIVFKEPEIIVKTVSAVSAGGSAGRQIAPGVLLMKSQDNLGNAEMRKFFLKIIFYFETKEMILKQTFDSSFSSIGNK